MKNPKFGRIQKLCLVMGLIFIILFISGPGYAKVLTDGYLLNTGVRAYEQDDLVTAVMYLFAYKERGPALMQQNPEFRKELLDALDYCITELKIREVAVEKIRRNNVKVGFKITKITKPPSIYIPSNAPRQLSPKHKSVFNHYPRTTTLRWQPVKGAVSYTVEIDCFHCCESGKWCSEVNGNTTIVSNLNQTEHVFDFVGAQPGRWRVWAVFNNGKSGIKSPWWEFRHTK